MNSNEDIISRYKQRTLSVESSKVSNADSREDFPIEEDVRKVRGWTALNISIEPLLFCVTYIGTNAQGVLLNLLERNACVHEYNMTAIQCDDRTMINSSMKMYLEQEAAQVNLAIQLIQGLCPVAMSLFIGPWSDNNGRKFFIILPTAGYFVYFLLWGVLSMYPYMPIRYMLIPSIPLSLTGGVVSVLVCCYCYLCDIFEPEARTYRFNIAMSFYLAGGLLANLTVSQLFNAGNEYGYALVFFINAFVAALSFVYACFCIEESVPTVKGKRFLFSWEYAKSVVTVLVMRPKGELIIILLTVVIIVSEVLLKSGESAVEYLIGKSQYSWDLDTFTLFSSYNTVIAVLSSALGSLVLKKLFHCKNVSIILFSALVMTLSEIARGFSSSNTMFWVTTGLSKTGALIGPTIAAEMSNVVSTEDLGKVYAFNALTESGSAYLSQPIYTSLYSSLISSQKTVNVYFLSAGISFIMVVAAVCFIFNDRNYREDAYIVNKS